MKVYSFIGGGNMAKNIVCNVRMTEDERHALRTAALKNKTTVQDVLYGAAKRYIAENEEEHA
jgi:hypothetical protein